MRETIKWDFPLTHTIRSNDKRPTLSNNDIIASTAIQCVAMAIP